ncbi:MAG: GNAT family N-acetyltransferase [Atopobiaceae bacterium]|nr:GNAT family N-acetyltransferase [Atopobiaceae bacterium]
MEIRRATQDDVESLEHLLLQVLEVHHAGRPDLFKPNSRKYTRGELELIIADDTRPIFVLDDDIHGVVAYAFCILEEITNDNVRCPRKSIYIDDLCVDEAVRGHGFGTQLYEYVRDYARSLGMDAITLNVWSLNTDALRFYEHLGLKPYRINMEELLS